MKFKVILNLRFYLPSPRKEVMDFEGHLRKNFSPLSTKLCSLFLNTRERIEEND